MPAAAAAAAAADTRLTPCMRSTCAGRTMLDLAKSHASSGNGDKAKRRKLKWPFGDVPCEQLVPTSTGHSGPPDSPSFGGFRGVNCCPGGVGFYRWQVSRYFLIPWRRGC
ncbi:hypothetical protein CLOM_g9089 [Closterium sp. NIES-68]|nr:hypothetical protein CLOM_g9089 [Closterium sp. NIES-68]